MFGTNYHGDVTPSEVVATLQMKNDECRGFDIRGETRRCNEIIFNREHALIGISPFNSRFSNEYVNSLIDWAAYHFLRVDVLLPCEEEASRLIVAAGSPASKAEKKTHREIGRHLKILEPIVARYRARNRPIRIFQFSDMKDNDAYQKERKRVEIAYETGPDFRDACMDMARQAVGGRMRGTGGNVSDLDDERVQLALPYIFAEIPFYVNTPALLGLKQSVLIYHRPWPIGTGLFAGRYPLRVHPSQGYGIITQRI